MVTGKNDPPSRTGGTGDRQRRGALQKVVWPSHACAPAV